MGSAALTTGEAIGDEAFSARVRRAFDPDGICNPGKVLPNRTACAESSKWPQMVDKVLDAEENR